MDDAFLEQINQVEMDALGQASAAGPVSSYDAGSRSSSGSEIGRGLGAQPSVIIVEDDEEDDKENVPLPARHVRRRVDVEDDADVINISD